MEREYACRARGHRNQRSSWVASTFPEVLHRLALTHELRLSHVRRHIDTRLVHLLVRALFLVDLLLQGELRLDVRSATHT